MMKAITEKMLGKKLGTIYFSGSGSISTYINGYKIKPVKQKEIFIDDYMANYLICVVNAKNIGEKV